MNNENSESRLANLQKQCFDPKSPLYIEKLLDLAAAVSYDIYSSGQLKESRSFKVFTERFNNISEIIKEQRLSVNDFKVVETIGKGGFGRVDLVRHKENKNIYAMKIIEKTTLIQNNFTGFWEERDILCGNNSDWLVKCYYSFFDLRKLYIVMEYMPGGDLFRWLEELEEFNEAQTHFYGMEIVLSVEYLHNMGFLHRDLKPENMLLDRHGHLKLADFGTCLAADENGKIKCNFQCGTPYYIPPEILRNNTVEDVTVGFEMDWWAVGVILYELYYGEIPFDDDSNSAVYLNIMNYKKTLKFPDDKPASDDYINMLRNIMTEPRERLKAKEIKKHPYFVNSIHPWTWTDIRQHSVPLDSFQVEKEDDTKYMGFDATQKISDSHTINSRNNFFTGENLAFTGFTFNRDYDYGRGLELSTSSASPGIVESGQKVNELMEKLKANENQLEERQMKLNVIQRKIDEKDQMIFEKEDVITQSNERIKQFKLKIDSYQQALENLEKQKLELNELMSNKETNLWKLNEEKLELDSKIVKMTKLLEENEADKMKMKSMLSEREKVADNLKNIEQMMHDTQQENESIKLSLNDKENRINELEADLNMLRNSGVEKDKGQLKSIESIEEKYQSIANEKRALESKLNLIESNLKNLSAEKTQLNKDLGQEKLLRQSLEFENKKLGTEIGEIRIVLDKMKSRYAELDDQKRLLTHRVTVVERERDKLEAEKRSADHLSTIYQTQKIELESQLDEFLEKWNDDKRHLRSENKKVVDELEAKKNEMKKTIIALDQSNDNVKRLEKELHERDVHISELDQSSRNEIMKLKKELEFSKEKVNSLVEKLEKMMNIPKVANAVAPSNQPRHKKKRQVDGGVGNAEFSRKMKNMESDLMIQAEKMKEKQKELDDLNNRYQTQMNLLRSMEMENQKKERTIEDLTRKLTQAVSRGSGDKPVLNMRKVTPGESVDYDSEDVNNNEDGTDTDLMYMSLRMEVCAEQFLHAKGGRRHKGNKWCKLRMILEPFRLQLVEYQDNVATNNNENAGTSNKLHILELRNIEHVRETNEADNLRLERSVLECVFQIIYNSKNDKSVKSDHLHDETVSLSGHEQYPTSSSTPSSTMRSSQFDLASHFNANTTNNTNSIIHFHDHDFIRVVFRRESASCSVCHQSLQNFLSPPQALECTKCKMRIHANHLTIDNTTSNSLLAGSVTNLNSLSVNTTNSSSLNATLTNNTTYIPQCVGNINVLFIKLESPENCRHWISKILKMKSIQQKREIQIGSNLYSSICYPNKTHSFARE